MNKGPSVSREAHGAWNILLLLLVALSVLGPLAFGLPVLGHLNGSDSNFALELTRGYTDALRAGEWFPRWLPAANAGMGSPVFYFYGRLPFLVAAVLGVALHLGPVGTLLAGFAFFRTLAFVTCRAWLRTVSQPLAADCGALLFLVAPYTMSLNVTTRVGFAETAATAFLPCLFLQLDRLLEDRRSVAGTVAALSLLYAAIAWCHAPQLLLSAAVTSLYVLLRRSLRGGLANVSGVAVGVLLAAPSVWPALLLQGTISAGGWRGTPHLQMRNNFLFTSARRFYYGFYKIDIDLYATWLICLLVLLMYVLGRSPALRRIPATTGFRSRGRAAAETLAVVLVAVTGLARPIWLLIPPLQAVQFPWRLFPAGLALAAALVALWAGTRKRRLYACLAVCGCLAAGQVGIGALGAAVSLTRWPLPFARRIGVAFRLPVYAPPAQREQPAYARGRSFVPEYIPADARRAGWQPSPNEQFLLPGPLVPSASVLTSGLQEIRRGDGTLRLTANLPLPRSVDLMLFYYPDEVVRELPSLIVHPDLRTGLASIDLPAGPATLTIAHSGALPPVRWSHRACIAGVILFLLCTLFARKELSARAV